MREAVRDLGAGPLQLEQVVHQVRARLRQVHTERLLALPPAHVQPAGISTLELAGHAGPDDVAPGRGRTPELPHRGLLDAPLPHTLHHHRRTQGVRWQRALTRGASGPDCRYLAAVDLADDGQVGPEDVVGQHHVDGAQAQRVHQHRGRARGPPLLEVEHGEALDAVRALSAPLARCELGVDEVQHHPHLHAALRLDRRVCSAVPHRYGHDGHGAVRVQQAQVPRVRAATSRAPCVDDDKQGPTHKNKSESAPRAAALLARQPSSARDNSSPSKLCTSCSAGLGYCCGRRLSTSLEQQQQQHVESGPGSVTDDAHPLALTLPASRRRGRRWGRTSAAPHRRCRRLGLRTCRPRETWAAAAKQTSRHTQNKENRISQFLGERGRRTVYDDVPACYKAR